MSLPAQNTDLTATCPEVGTSAMKPGNLLMNSADWIASIGSSLPLTETLAKMPGGHQSLVFSLYILLKKLKASAMSDVLLGS